MIHLKNSEEIALMKEAAQLVSKTLGMLAPEIKPGANTLHLDQLAETFIRDHGGIPAFKGMYNFPNTLCTSVNEAVVHGYPSKEPLKEGDVVSVDCGVILNGFYGDHAYSFEVGEVAPATRKLLQVTRESLELGIAQCRAGNRIGDIGYAIQLHAERHGFGVVRDLVGHGLGKRLHEEPQVPNYGKKGKGPLIQEGLVLAIEPMINMGTHRVRTLRDGWSIVSGDGRPSAHFEHDVAVVNGEPYVLSTFRYIEDALGIPHSAH